MGKARQLHKRAAMRLEHFDYTQGGPYFLTICLQRRTPLLGKITDRGSVALNPFGVMITTVWRAMPEYNPGLILDEFIVMPDHFHAIIGFVDPHIWRALWPATTDAEVDQDDSKKFSRLSVSKIVGRFKLQTLKHYRQGVTESGWPTYAGQLWQRGYWDRIVRSERDLQSHREYIYNNVWKKHLDRITDSP